MLSIEKEEEEGKDQLPVRFSLSLIGRFHLPTQLFLNSRGIRDVISATIFHLPKYHLPLLSSLSPLSMHNHGPVDSYQPNGEGRTRRRMCCVEGMRDFVLPVSSTSLKSR